MIRAPLNGRWLALLALAGLTLLYADAIQTRFLNDDYLFLEEARRPLAQSIGSLGPLGNYYRPLSRQLTFEALAPLAQDRPWVFHLFGYSLFLSSLLMLAGLLRTLMPPAGVWAGTLYFALLPFQRVNLMWVSCVQDLMALTLALASFALFRRGRQVLAGIGYLLAIFSKESALPLPLALLAWDRWVAPARSGAAGEGGPRAEKKSDRWQRYLPFAVSAVAWAVVMAWVWARHPGVRPPVSFSPSHFAAAYLHAAQSLLGLDHPPSLLASLLAHGPRPAALAPLCVAALLIPARDQGRSPARGAARFALAWIAALTLVTGPVADSWSSYYYTLAGVGAAVLVGLAFARSGPTVLMILTAGLLWWHAGATSVRAFAVARDPWVWSSHLTPYYFGQVAVTSGRLSTQLKRLDPDPPPDSRFFFATLPSFAGFQMGNGALIRALYGDPSLQSHFISQFSETTAAFAPCRFLYWDGVELQPYPRPGMDVFFQVGTDLLALDRLAGARHAFRRALVEGESRMDVLYWLGWTELWLGRRGMAEAAWSAVGAGDDSAAWHMDMRRARQALNDEGDTLTARRELAAAIRHGMGRPEAHAVLGSLLLPSHPKYGVLELKVAVTLHPQDWLARLELVAELLRQGLDESAQREFARLVEERPDWRQDSVLVAIGGALDRRADATSRVIED